MTTSRLPLFGVLAVGALALAGRQVQAERRRGSHEAVAAQFCATWDRLLQDRR